MSRKEVEVYKYYYCLFGKLIRIISYNKLSKLNRVIFELYINIILYKLEGIGSKNYVIYTVCPKLKFQWYIVVNKKLEGFDTIINFITYLENMIGMKVQIVYIDNGIEFVLNKLRDWYKNRGITLITIVLDCLE